MATRLRYHEMGHHVRKSRISPSAPGGDPEQKRTPRPRSRFLSGRPALPSSPVLSALPVVAGLAALLLLAGACGGDDTNERENPSTGDAGTAAAVLGPAAAATGEPVRVGLISDGRSPVSDTSIEGRVAEATVKYLNEHRSGIAGRPIRLIACESLADPGKSADCANRMIEENVVAVIAGSLAAPEGVWKPLHDAQVPVIFPVATGSALLGDSDSTFVMTDLIFPYVTLPIQLAKDNRVSKVTMVVVDVPSAVSVSKVLAPPLFEQAGIDFDSVAIPPGTADMTPQMQRLASDDPGIVHIVGPDAFCISALNGLRAVGFTGHVSGISQCISDATRTAVPGDMLDGMAVAASVPVGADNPSTRLYDTVSSSYGSGIDTSRTSGMIMFLAVTGLQAALEGISGEITPATVTTTVRSMPEKDLPGATGLRFRCNGKAYPSTPAVCVRGGLLTILDDEGQPTAYRPIGTSPIED